jgi:hypothetical protein
VRLARKGLRWGAFGVLAWFLVEAGIAGWAYIEFMHDQPVFDVDAVQQLNERLMK